MFFWFPVWGSHVRPLSFEKISQEGGAGRSGQFEHGDLPKIVNHLGSLQMLNYCMWDP